MQIKDKKVVTVIIGGKPILGQDIAYWIAVGDDAFMLKDLPQINNGYLMRDALIDYATALKTIKVELQNRVRKAE